MGSSYCERTLDLKYGGEGEAHETLCRQSRSYEDAIILAVIPV